MMLKKKYFVVFVVKQEGSYNILKRIRIKPDIQVVRYKVDITHSIDITQPTYSRGLRLFYFIDISGGQLFFNNDGEKKNPALLDLVLKQGIIKQLTTSLHARMGGLYSNIIIALVVGALIGWIIRGFF